MMLARAIASLLLCMSITLGLFPNYAPDIASFAGGSKASYDGYTLTLADGGTLDVRLSGSKIVFTSDQERDYDLLLRSVERGYTVNTCTRSGGVFEVDFSGEMDEGDLYCLEIWYKAFGYAVAVSDNVIFKSGSNVYFHESVNYDYNVSTCAELKTDEQSLAEYLKPQNDIECDDPFIIGYSEQLCEGAVDDWDKVFRIYTYVTQELAYDNEEVECGGGGYQDSAAAVIRDGKGICEGFSNCFVALCRAQGIPAAVQFGLGFNDSNEVTPVDQVNGEYADHAWAAVYLGDKWLFADPTYDIQTIFDVNGNYERTSLPPMFYLLPLEAMSNDHRILDADTAHGLESSGSCGYNAQYVITRDGVCHISGEGTICMPRGVNGFNKIVFDAGSNITELDSQCFLDCDLVTSVVLPDTVKTVGDYAFFSCEDLEYIYIPEGVEKIGVQAFCYCDELSYCRIPDTTTELAQWAFDFDPRLYLSLPTHLKDDMYDYECEPMHIEFR